MHIHILGICGTFMAGIALLAKQMGHQVSGSDINVYPPMSTQLQHQGITLHEGYHPEHLTPAPDYIIVGNTMSRGNPAIEFMLNENLPYISGPQWLAENILFDRWVLAVAGTHGKTTTSSMIAWILAHAGLNPGFLIGGIPQNFGVSAQLGQSPFFVIEADEYDTAFFDKRSKFIHYHPKTVVLNNLEFDHADIFSDLNAIKTQVHHLIRTIPSKGLILCNGEDENLQETLKKGCWTPVEYIEGPNASWKAKAINLDGSQFEIYANNKYVGQLKWHLLGKHNMHNALMAIASAHHAGVSVEQAILALSEFKNVKRRLEIIGQANEITYYDDFAHHPTAIATTLDGLRNKVNASRIIAVLELGSFTMRTGVHKESLIPALQKADEVFLALPKEDWGVEELAKKLSVPAQVYPNVDEIIEALIQRTRGGDHVVIMSNTGFNGLHDKLLKAIKSDKFIL